MADYNILSYTQDWQQVFQVDSDYAFEWGFVSGRLQPAAGGKETEYRYKVLRVLKRDSDGNWKVHRTSWNDASGQEQPTSSGAEANQQH
jgi:ketosteroid isomerase-like protein